MTLIKDKTELNSIAMEFLDLLFARTLDNEQGEIEIKLIKDGVVHSTFQSNYEQIPELSYLGCNNGFNVYFGVNPRVGGAGKKENVINITAFHAEVDYGEIGHKKKPEYDTYEEALETIQAYDMKPTAVIHSGGGFHCYWVLNNYISVEKYGVDVLESINKRLSRDLKADPGTHDLGRVLRIPFTFNLKNPGNPREVTIITMDGPKYDFEDFQKFLKTEKPVEPKKVDKPSTSSPSTWDKDIENLNVSEKIKSLINQGNTGGYSSRSEADMAVICALIDKGYGTADIKKIFQKYLIGDKYRTHKNPDYYLDHSIKRAQSMSDFTEEERQDPLFISGSIQKKNKSVVLKPVPFQELISRRHIIKYHEEENAIFRYNSKCYEIVSKKKLNKLCQDELGKYRALFSDSKLKEIIHFLTGYDLMDVKQAKQDQLRYLTFPNGLFDLTRMELVPHSKDIFTTNLLPYDFAPEAECPLFKKFLGDIFESSREKIDFIQEAMGYCFHKAMPKPSIFFLIGPGSNGKSVFIDNLSNLVGEENACTISLSSFTRELYLSDLFGKMINISSETPRKRQIDSDVVKSVSGGDWVAGRKLYNEPVKFKPFAKHFLAMNEFPTIEDTSHGMWRRIYMIEFLRIFSEKEMDVHLTEKLKSELSGIFNFALEGYKRLRKNRFIFTKAKSMNDTKEKYKNQSSSVLSFINQFLAQGEPEEKVVFKGLYALYQRYCDDEGLKDINKKAAFKNQLTTAGFEISNSKKDANKLCVFGAKLQGSLEE